MHRHPQHRRTASWVWPPGGKAAAVRWASGRTASGPGARSGRQCSYPAGAVASSRRAEAAGRFLTAAMPAGRGDAASCARPGEVMASRDCLQVGERVSLGRAVLVEKIEGMPGQRGDAAIRADQMHDTAGALLPAAHLTPEHGFHRAAGRCEHRPGRSVRPPEGAGPAPPGGHGRGERTPPSAKNRRPIRAGGNNRGTADEAATTSARACSAPDNSTGRPLGTRTAQARTRSDRLSPNSSPARPRSSPLERLGTRIGGNAHSWSKPVFVARQEATHDPAEVPNDSAPRSGTPALSSASATPSP